MIFTYKIYPSTIRFFFRIGPFRFNMKIIVALRESRIREIPSIASIDFAFPVILRFQGERLARRRRANVRTHTYIVCVFVYIYIHVCTVWYTRMYVALCASYASPYEYVCVVWGKKGVTSRRHDRCVYSVEEKDGVWNASRVVKILQYHRALEELVSDGGKNWNSCKELTVI